MNVTLAPTMVGSNSVQMATRRLNDDVLEVQVNLNGEHNATLCLLVRGNDSEIEAVAKFCSQAMVAELPAQPEKDVHVTDDMVDGRDLAVRKCVERLVESMLISVDYAPNVIDNWLSGGWGITAIEKMTETMLKNAERLELEGKLYGETYA